MTRRLPKEPVSRWPFTIWKRIFERRQAPLRSSVRLSICKIGLELPSLHHPVSKRFPTVSASDVGSIAAELLTDGTTAAEPRIVHAEGPRRYDAIDVATTLGNIIGREIVARELRQSDWIPTLTRAGAGPSYARLVFKMYVAHNAGRIDVEPGREPLISGLEQLN